MRQFDVRAIQSTEQIQEILDRLLGQQFAMLQVLGINALKSLAPTPENVIGEVISGTQVIDRTFKINTSNICIAFDLQRTGRLIWLESAEPFRRVAGASGPTVRILLADGTGLDMTEPAKTKRITATLFATGK